MVQVTELDVSDPASPRVLRRTDLDGSYIDARGVGDRVFVVVSGGLGMPAPEARSTATEVVYETEAEYRARVGAIDAGTLLPQFRSTVTAEDGTTTEATGPLVEAGSISRPSLSQDQSLLSVVVFDARRPGQGPVGSTGLVASYRPFVYMTADHLYLSSSANVPISDAQSPGRELTLIRKLELAGDDPTLTAIGAIPGRPLNQFAFDEHEGFLRVATTKSVWNGGPPDLSNALYVLGQRGGSLTTVGSIEDLAPGERVFSARFLGDRGYLVTFRQVDPLFGLDLGDPTAPACSAS
ncbi:MAG: beta-propeller domain-containing protein [Singulisphaera sp.]